MAIAAVGAIGASGTAGAATNLLRDNSAGMPDVSRTIAYQTPVSVHLLPVSVHPLPVSRPGKASRNPIELAERLGVPLAYVTSMDAATARHRRPTHRARQIGRCPPMN
jgi:hypothetical protein